MNTSNLAKKRPFWLSRSIKHCSDWSQSFDWEIILPIYHSRKTYGAVPMKGRSINFDFILCLKLWSLFMMSIEGTVILCIELLCRLNQLSLGVNRPSGSWRFPWPWCRERENSSSCSITLKTLPLFFVYKRLFQGNFSRQSCLAKWEQIISEFWELSGVAEWRITFNSENIVQGPTEYGDHSQISKAF